MAAAIGWVVPLGDRLDLGVVVGERRALDGVAGVEGEGVAGPPLGADGLDERGRLGQADVVVLAVVVLGVLEVVPVVDVAVQVGRADHGERVVVGAARVAGRRLGGRGRPARRDRRHRRRRRWPWRAAGGGWSRDWMSRWVMSLQGVGVGPTAGGSDRGPQGTFPALRGYRNLRTPPPSAPGGARWASPAHHDRPRGRRWWPFRPILHNDCPRGQLWWVRRASPRPPVDERAAGWSPTGSIDG